MTAERIDVQVTDKVDANVAKKLNQIADGADRGANYLKKLQDALSAVNTTALDRLASAMAKADSAQARLLSAQARLTNAQNAGSLQAEKLALAQQKLATEAARTEAAQARASAATSGAALAAQRLQAAAAATTGASAGAANAQQQLAAATAGAGAAAGGAGNQWRAYINTMTQSSNAAAGATTAATRVAGGMNNVAGAHMNYQRAARQTTAVNANIIAQMQDIGVSLAGGQNPLLVMIQQGSQLSYIASTMDGGMKALLLTIGRMALAWAPVIAAVGAAYLAFKSFTDVLNDDAANKKFVQSLGLTKAEIKKLGDTSITMGDTIKAVWQVLSQNILNAVGLSTSQVKSYWNEMTSTILKWSVAAFLGIGAAAVTLVKWIAVTIDNIRKIFYNAGVGAANLFLMGIQLLVNGVAKAMNKIGGFINMLSNKAGLGDVVGKFDEINLGVKGATDGMVKLSSIDLSGEFQKGLENGYNTLKRIGQQARINHDERLRQKAEELKADRADKKPKKPKVDHTAENRAHAIEMVNLKLDDELKRMHMLKDEREVQQRMDQIEESLAQKKIHLNAQEEASIRKKVEAIVAYKYVQAEMDRIYEQTVGPMRTYQASLKAIDELHQKGVLSTKQVTEQTNLAARAYQEATDKLFDLKRQMENDTVAAGLYGDAVQQNSYYQQIRNSEFGKANNLSAQYVAGVNAEVDALMRQNAALQQQQYVQSQVGEVVNPILDDKKLLDNKAAIYAELNRMADQYNLNEAQRKQALAKLDLKYDQMRLEGASQFFGQLAQLSSSKNKKLAAIGKAAAVAQATIDGYLAVQKALATIPPPFNIPVAAATAVMTGVQVAGILSTNVGSFATGGQFTVRGRDGVDANNINMNVTKGERVTIETPAQQRANDAGGATHVSVPVKVINVRDEREMANYLQSEEGERLVLNILKDNPAHVAAAANAAK